MSTAQTDRAALMDTLLREKTGFGLDETVSRLRDQGLGQRPIAERLQGLTGVEVHWRTVGRWIARLDTGSAA